MSQPFQYAVPATALYYRPGRAFEPVRLGLGLPNALVLAAVLGGAYGAVEFEARSLYLRVGTAAAAAALLGLLTAGLLRFAQVHNRALAVLLGTLVGGVGLWASWVVWVWLVLRDFYPTLSPLDLAASPVGLYRLARGINLLGVWEYRGNVFHGPVLTVVWVAEALVLILGCTLVASHVGKPGVFCPACRKGCSPVTGLGRFDGTDTADLRDRLEAHDFDHLLALGPVRDDDDPEVRLELLCCPCGETNVLNARRVAWEDNGQGLAAVKERPLVTGLLLTPEQAAGVRSLKGRLADESPADSIDEASDDDDGTGRGGPDDPGGRPDLGGPDGPDPRR